MGVIFKSKINFKLTKLRRIMFEKGINAFLIPRTDEYNGEYVSSYGERLRWIFGFSGSAGLGIVTYNNAVIFVDGRYILQAKKDLDLNIEIRCLKLFQVISWVNSGIVNKKVFYDPWVTGYSQVRQYLSYGINMIPMPNILDLIWEEQPNIPNYPAFSHEYKYSGENSEDKCIRLSYNLKKYNLDSAIISSPENICWLLNVRGADIPFTPIILSRAILNKNGSVIWFVEKKRLLNIILPFHVKQQEPENLFHFLFLLNGKNVLVDPRTTPTALINYLKFASVCCVFKEEPCIFEKSCKNLIEEKGIKSAHVRDGVAISRFLFYLQKEVFKTNVNEILAAEKLFCFRKFQDLFQGSSFSTISGCKSNSAIIHYNVTPETNRSLSDKGLYLIDSGGQYLDGTTDVTRTFCFGDPIDEYKDRFTRVLKGNIALSKFRFPEGTTGGQLDILARQFLWEDGLDYSHGTGHGVGSFLSVHEGPQSISSIGYHTPLYPGMILSNEPGYYKYGCFGIRIENLLIVKKYKSPSKQKSMLCFETLTLVPIQLSLIKKEIMTELECHWLNKYHSRVFRTISPFLNQKERLWLSKETLII